MEHSQTIAKYDRETGSYNSVKAHIFDVSAIAYWLIQTESDEILDELCAGLGLPRRSLPSWVAYLAGLHDLMKLSWPFQVMPGISQKFGELNPNVDIESLQTQIHKFTRRWPEVKYNFLPQKGDPNTTVSPLQHALLLSSVLPAFLVQATGVGLKAGRRSEGRR